MLDATRAAREVLAREHLAQPRARGDREALRVLLATRRCVVDARTKAINQLKALIVSAPPALRERLRQHCTSQQVRCCARLRVHATHTTEHRVTVQAMRATARRIIFLEAEAAQHQAELDRLVGQVAPSLLDELGVGTLTAAQPRAWSVGAGASWMPASIHRSRRLHSGLPSSTLAGGRPGRRLRGQAGVVIGTRIR